LKHEEETMREQLEARLTELEQEYQTGEQRLRDVDLQQARLRETLLRISGAIQVLHELLESSGGASDSEPPETGKASPNGHEQPAVITDTPIAASS
jgi:predicted nuclease with TOPRIM domain